jgi:hypothetical protein
MSQPFSLVAACLQSMERTGAYRATKIIARNRTIKVTRQSGRRKLRKNERQRSYLVTIGRPNYRESAFIKDCLAAGEPLPVHKVLLQFPPKTRSDHAKLGGCHAAEE